jgi:hypothetical protein
VFADLNNNGKVDVVVADDSTPNGVLRRLQPALSQ